MSKTRPRIRSLKKFHFAALCGIGGCLLVTAVASYLLFVEPNASSNSRIGYLVLMFVAVSGIVAISIWLYFATIPTMRHDIYTLVRMFKDVREGAVRVSYPVMLNEFAVAHRYLRNWGEEMIAEKGRLTDMGLIDHLSQLSNRRHFEMRLNELFDNTRTHGPSSVLIIDLDHFKQVNDQHGHDAGDALIVQFAALLRANVRHTDLLARLGGDEFCIIYTYVSLSKAEELVERLRRALPREIELKPGVRHALRWTGGLSIIDDDDTKSDDVLWRADQSLLRAKETGRNRTIVHDPKTVPPSEPPA